MSNNEDKTRPLSDEVRELADTSSPWPQGADNTANVLKERRELSAPLSDAEARKAMAVRSRRGFLVGGAAAIAAVLGWRWMPDETKAALLKKTLRFNERVARTLFSVDRLAPEFAQADVTRPARFNGGVGLDSEIDLAAWRLSIGGISAGPDIEMTMDDIRSFPRVEYITRFMCIEGWSTIVHWTGARFSDLVARVTPYKDLAAMPEYVSLTTPDNGYFVGWDKAAIMHPQTLLVYEMNGEVLTPEHGAPLRLASPLKYGIKQIKRIGRIEFTSERPADYWASDDQGYDWYSGL